MTVVDSSDAMSATSPEKEPPPSMVERMTLILDAFEGRTSRLMLEEITCRTRLPRSTVYRILDQLVRLDWVDHASFGYCLGRRAMGLTVDDNDPGRIRTAAAPVLHELHMRTGMVVHLTVLEGVDTVYLDKVGGRMASRLPSRVGGRVPAYATACGKAMLAGIDPEDVDSLYGERLERRTARTITELTALHQELGRIRRRRGLAFEHGESVIGFGCVGVAVRGVDGPVAGLSLCSDAGAAQIERVAPLLVDAGREIARTLQADREHRRHDNRPAHSTPTLEQKPA